MMMQYLDEAVTACENLLEVSSSPTDAASESSNVQLSWTEACQTVGNVLTGMGFVEEAYPWRSMAFDLAPDRAKFYAESGRVYCQCEAWDKAIYFCQHALEQQPENASVRRRLAGIYNQLGNYREETQVVNELLTLQPETATAQGHHQLGQVLQKQGRSKQAAKCYERAIAQDNQYVAAYYALGEVWSQQRQWDKAVALFEGLIEERPNEAMAHYRLGRVHKQAQQFEQAIACFRSALKIDAQLHWAYMGLLNTLMQMQRWDETIEICQGVLNVSDRFPWIYGFMGNAFARKGDLSQAASCHQQSFAAQGWQGCAEQDYQFGLTWFSESISLWKAHLAPLNERLAERSLIRALALGSRNDGSLFWLADEVLQQPGDRLLCLTPQIDEAFEMNLRKSAQAEKIVVEVGNLPQQLAGLTESKPSESRPFESKPSDQKSEQAFEIIVVQSDRRRADEVKAIATQAWNLLKPGGFILFRDYLWHHPTEPAQSSKVGIDAFIAVVTNHAAVLHQSHQLMLKKTLKKETPLDA